MSNLNPLYILEALKVRGQSGEVGLVSHKLARRLKHDQNTRVRDIMNDEYGSRAAGNAAEYMKKAGKDAAYYKAKGGLIGSIRGEGNKILGKTQRAQHNW